MHLKKYIVPIKPLEGSLEKQFNQMDGHMLKNMDLSGSQEKH